MMFSKTLARLPLPAVSRSTRCTCLFLQRSFSITKQPRSGDKRTVFSLADVAKLKPVGPPLGEQKLLAPTMLHHIMRVQKQYPESVVLTQVGSFFEIYFDQAVELAPQLNLKLARKNQRCPSGKANFVNMAGFPLQQKEKYEKMLVQDLGKTVVIMLQNSASILDELSEEEKRPVSRILSPGTLLSESFADQNSNNYLLAVKPKGTSHMALVWTDIASGKVSYEVIHNHELGNEFSRLSPSEILVPRGSTDGKLGFIKEHAQIYAPKAVISAYTYPPVEFLATIGNEKQIFYINSLPQPVQSAYSGLLSYINECMPESPADIQEPEFFNSRDIMQLDARARDALELTKAPTGARSSLLSLTRRTKSISGGRLYQEWLLSPLQNINLIKKRQDRVAYFMQCPESVTRSIQEFLTGLPDGHRQVQKFATKRMDPFDFVVFANSVKSLAQIAGLLKGSEFDMSRLLTEPMKLAKKVMKTINTDELIARKSSATLSLDGEVNIPSASSAFTTSKIFETSNQYKPVLSPNVSPLLTTLCEKQRKVELEAHHLRAKLRQKFGNCELKWSPGHHFYVQVPITSPSDVKEFQIIKTHKRVAYIVNDEWRSLGTDQLIINEELKMEEVRLLEELRLSVAQLKPIMRMAYNMADEVDVYLALATLAKEKQLVRPELCSENGIFEVIGGRHITVETGIVLTGMKNTNNAQIGGFVKNDCILSNPKSIAMISGPNMGGKSTFIRQNAIITLLAHIGSFVPADSVKMSIVDRIFCRLGAGDDLYNGRSTFMMEMLETASILTDATPNSLAILDEVGRGTSGKDGVAIAFATLKHLALKNKCRTLFATHYGQEIWKLIKSEFGADTAKAINTLQASAGVSDDGSLIFDYALKPGVSASSYGLMIAKMAGYPESAIREAEQVSTTL